MRGPRLSGWLGLLLLFGGCDREGSPLHWDFERMTHQPRYAPYAASPLFRDGRAMRAPPPGTLPVTSPRGAADDETARPAPEPALLERGRGRFRIYCAACHGPDGRARTHVAAMMRLRAPPSLHEPRIRVRGLEHVHRVIEAGYGLMPSYAPLLGARDRWAVTYFVEALWLSGSVPLDALPEPLRERALQGLGAGGAP